MSPVKDGEATITARAGDRTATAKVKVAGMAQPFAWSFRNHVEPILASKGATPGRATAPWPAKGVSGSRSRAMTPRATTSASSSRIEGGGSSWAIPVGACSWPNPRARSPTKGGVRFSTDSLEYRILVRAGSPRERPGRASTKRRVDRLEVSPDRSLQRVGQGQQILVRAHYSDGRAEDVTRWAKWSSADESVCRVDEQGKAQVIGPGEGSIVAWFASKLAIARITVPYEKWPADRDRGNRRSPQAEELHRRAGR